MLKNFKIITVLIICILVGIVFVACNGLNKDNKNDQEQTTEQQDDSPTNDEDNSDNKKKDDIEWPKINF